MTDRVVIDGASLTCAQVARAGRGQARVEVAPAAVAAARTAWQVAREVAASGRSTAGPPGWAPTARSRCPPPRPPSTG